MDDGKLENQPILTSTMGNVLLSQNNDNKNDANDSLPTSSTDADSSYSKLNANVSDDPISSTSSELSEKQKGLLVGSEDSKKQSMDSPKSISENDAELDINTVIAPSEPTNENVEDIAQDLENLLGESDPSDDYPIQKKEHLHDKGLASTSLKDLANEFDTNINNDETDRISHETVEIANPQIEIKNLESSKVCLKNENFVSSQPIKENTEIPVENNIEIQEIVETDNENVEPIITKLVENQIISAKTLEEELLVKKITTGESSETHSIASSLEVLPDPETTNIDEFINDTDSVTSRQNSIEDDKFVLKKEENLADLVEVSACPLNSEEGKENNQEIESIETEKEKNIPKLESGTEIVSPPEIEQEKPEEVNEATESATDEISTKIFQEEQKLKEEESTHLAKGETPVPAVGTTETVGEKEEKKSEINEQICENLEKHVEHIDEHISEPTEESTVERISETPVAKVEQISETPVAQIEKISESPVTNIERISETPVAQIEKISESPVTNIEQISEDSKEKKENILQLEEKTEKTQNLDESVDEIPEQTELNSLLETPQEISELPLEGPEKNFKPTPESPDENIEKIESKEPEKELISEEISEISPSEKVTEEISASELIDQKIPEFHEEKSPELPTETVPSHSEICNQESLLSESPNQENLCSEQLDQEKLPSEQLHQEKLPSELPNQQISLSEFLQESEHVPETLQTIQFSQSNEPTIQKETEGTVQMDQKTNQIENFSKISDEKEIEGEKVEPVVEEVIVKKTVIYEHDCVQARNEVAETTQEESTIKSKEPEEDSTSSVEYIGSSSSQERLDKDDSNSSSSEMIKIIEKRTLTQLTKSNENIDSYPENEKIIKNESKNDSQKEVDDAVSSITMDQTTAAVQSILDNMLAEEQNIETVSSKEDTQLVHSSYSSYELQKAVQQIQSIQEIHEEPAEISVEQSSETYVPEIEKYEEPQIQVQEEPKTENKEREIVEQQEVELPVVQPSIDLSEESSSSDESSENEKIAQKNQSKEDISEPLSINVDVSDKEKNYSPKITIKLKEDEQPPSDDKEEHKGSLKITITKQSDNTHSILKICSPDVENRSKNPENDEHNVIPKLVIKTSDVEQHSPKMRASKQSTSCTNQRSGSPRITIKPIPKPDTKEGSPLKMTIKPLGKPEEFSKQQQQRHSPKLPKSKAEDDHYTTRSKMMKMNENEPHSPKVTIKPIVKPQEEEHNVPTTPKITIKPVEKPETEAKVSPKITIKPVIKPVEETEERIVLKINKGNLPGGDKPRKREHEEEKLAKIKLKFSKGGDAHIVHDESPPKKFKNDDNDDDDVKIIEERHSPIVISEDSRSQDSVIIIDESKNVQPVVHQAPEPVIVAPSIPPPPAPRKRGRPRKVPLVVREDFSNTGKEEIPPPPITSPSIETSKNDTGGRPKRSCRGQSVRDTLGIKPRKTKTPSKPRGGKRGPKGRDQNLSAAKLELIQKTLSDQNVVHDVGLLKIATTTNKQSVNKPLELKGLLEAAKDQNIIEIIEIDSPSSTKSSEDVLGNEKKCRKDDDIGINELEMHPPTPYFAQPFSGESTMDISHSSDIAMFEEETRMSAEAHSRAQTPAKQVVSSDVIMEESQSSLQSTATTESGKISRRNRLEVHQEIDASISSVDQLNEYYWGGNGPFMIQEQVAQFLGIKSFKRKYPNMPRRMVDMQERDYIRESGLASESMCDLGLTAVNSADVLDIMYSDFQDKYEEYCKYLRDKQAKDLQNKQKALSAAASHEKNKLDIVEQAINSTVSYNANFNKARREQRKACMDLQTMNVHYPKGKMKALKLPKVGNYPVSVVPGQYVDYYKEFTPTELNNFPINTMLYTELHKILPEISDSDSDSSGSDSDESSSSGSDSDTSCEDNCKMCNAGGDKKNLTARKSPSIHAGV